MLLKFPLIGSTHLDSADKQTAESAKLIKIIKCIQLTASGHYLMYLCNLLLEAVRDKWLYLHEFKIR